MYIGELIDKFIYHLQYEKNASPKTIENYTLRLNRFIAHTGDMEVEQLKRMHVLDYRMSLHQQWLSVKTINYHIVALRSFLKFLHKNDISCMAPDKVELAKTPTREVHYLTEDEVYALLDAPLSYTIDPVKQARDQTILRLLYGTGLRVSELINLKIEDVTREWNQFSILGKWSKRRAVFMVPQAKEKLRLYLDVRTDDSEYVCISLSANTYGNKLSRNAVEELVRTYSAFVGIEKKVTPHTLRHSFATSLLKKWADIRSVQALLWHASITTTQIYTHVDDKHLKEVHSLLEG